MATRYVVVTGTGEFDTFVVSAPGVAGSYMRDGQFYWRFAHATLAEARTAAAAYTADLYARGRKELAKHFEVDPVAAAARLERAIASQSIRVLPTVHDWTEQELLSLGGRHHAGVTFDGYAALSYGPIT